MDINLFDFDLPKELIAQNPSIQRTDSKLLHLKHNGLIIDYKFPEIMHIVSDGDVLVLNNTKVIPALLHVIEVNGLKKKVSINLVKQISHDVWQIMAKPAKALNQNDVLLIESKTNQNLKASVILKNIDTIYIRSDDDIMSFAIQNGHMPLPPYIKRDQLLNDDYERYQTVYAKSYGAVAAPTAGLHFTDELLEKLKAKGVMITYVTLHVGLGTFYPIKVNNISEHKMHSEWYDIDQDACDIINAARYSNKRIICVGTTSMRVLESAAREGDLKPSSGETNIFIRPGHEFQIASGLITNFHLPKSTLYILVSAFSGINNIKTAYDHAIKNSYRFFSYGDACYLERAV